MKGSIIKFEIKTNKEVESLLLHSNFQGHLKCIFSNKNIKVSFFERFKIFKRKRVMKMCYHI